MSVSENPLHQVFLAGIGAIAIGAERTQRLVDELVGKGQITVGQGRDLASEISSRTEEDAARIRDGLVGAYMNGMTSEQRAEFAASVADMAAVMDEAERSRSGDSGGCDVAQSTEPPCEGESAAFAAGHACGDAFRQVRPESEKPVQESVGVA